MHAFSLLMKALPMSVPPQETGHEDHGDQELRTPSTAFKRNESSLLLTEEYI